MSSESWTEIVTDSLSSLWLGFIDFVPNLLGAIVVFIVGCIIAVVLAQLVERIIRSLRIDHILEKTGFKKSLEKANLKLNSGKFLGELTKWFFIVAFLMAATEILHLPEITDFLKRVFFYLPQLIVAVLILLAAVLIANFLQKLVKATLEGAGMAAANALAAVTKWSILIFAILAALIQLGIAITMIQTLFAGLVAALAISVGLSFGLGGKEAAAEVIRKIKNNISGE